MTLLSEIYDVVHSNMDCCSPRATLAQNLVTDHDYNCDGLAPVANFTVNIAAGNAPTTVNFSDLSSGEITSYLWNFGDGTTSTATSPSHIYSAVGTYTVSLTVTGPGGAGVETKTSFISVSPALVDGGFYVGDLGGYRIICAPIEGQTTADWGPYTDVPGADSPTDGYQNTLDLIAYTQDHPAANFCSNLTIGGFSDWYLPSKDELNLLYQNRSALEAAGAGAFDDSYYWSSTEYSTFYAWHQSFYSGYQFNYYKDSTYCVRAVRRLPLV